MNDAVQTGLKASGELGPETMRLQTLSRVNVTREELRYASTYAPGMVVEVARREGLAIVVPGPGSGRVLVGDGSRPPRPVELPVTLAASPRLLGGGLLVPGTDGLVYQYQDQ